MGAIVLLDPAVVGEDAAEGEVEAGPVEGPMVVVEAEPAEDVVEDAGIATVVEVVADEPVEELPQPTVPKATAATAEQDQIRIRDICH